MTSFYDWFNLKNWKLTLPVDANGTVTGPAANIRDLNGYSNPDFFHFDADGAMVFDASVDGATTGSSTHARSELREMVTPTTEAAWTLKQGGTMSATLSVDKTPLAADGSPASVIIGQIHGVSDELIRLYYREGTVYFVNDQAGAKNVPTAFQLRDANGNTPNVSLGEKFSYTIDAHGSTLSVNVVADGITYSSVTKINSVWQSDHLYFKAGLYLGVNENEGSGSGQVAFYDLDFTHATTGTTALAAPSVVSDTTVTGGIGAALSLIGDDGDNTLRGGIYSDTIIGNGGNDLLFGYEGSDKLYGGTGDDQLDGGAGIDYMYGGEGNDVYIVDNILDKVSEGSPLTDPGGTDLVLSSVTFNLGANVENLTLTGIGAINAGGNGLSNILIGNDGMNVLNGGGGADIMKGGGADDTYYVNTSYDVIVEYDGQGGHDQVFATSSYTLSANVENLTLIGTATSAKGNELDNVLTGNDSDNKIYGFAGDDRIDGGLGADLMVGGLGNDTYTVDNAGDVVKELADQGIELVKSSVTFTLSANVENLDLTGVEMINGTGNALDNEISGNNSANYLTGGLGNDILSGNGGADHFVFNTGITDGNNVDTITDFRSRYDHIDLDQAIFFGLPAGTLQSSAFVIGTAALTADQHVIYDQSTGNLYFDADGAGGADAFQFAHVDPGTTLASSDFLIF